MGWVRLRTGFIGIAFIISLGFLVPNPVQAQESSLNMPLSSTEISQKLQAFPNWNLKNNGIQRTFKFKNFIEAIAFVNRLVEPAETLGHHPDLAISYNQVTVRLTTHDAGGLTPLDFALAQQIDRLAQ
jgi:4a-hydroxytetrahydrobiopterin dehydratase